MKIPLSKIPIDAEIKTAVNSVLDSGNFILGQQTKKFEEKFAKLCNVKYAACVSSGTAALFLTLKSLEIKKGDEIIVPSLSYVATATPVLMLGAKPIFVDVNLRNYTIDHERIEERITTKTKGIIPVHLYGHPVNMDKIKKIARDYSLFVVEDAAQAHGAKYKGKPVGGLGDAACFSFYPSKNLTVCGDGGIVTSNNKRLIDNITMLRDHGRKEKYVHKILGYNLRFNEIQAAIGLVMLKKLSKFNSKRRKLAKNYSRILENDVITPIEEKWATHVYHMYTIRNPIRNKLQKELKKLGIASGVHYPIPIHRQPVFRKFGSGDLSNTDEIANTTLSLPLFPDLSQNQVEFVAKKVIKILNS